MKLMGVGLCRIGMLFRCFLSFLIGVRIRGILRIGLMLQVMLGSRRVRQRSIRDDLIYFYRLTIRTILLSLDCFIIILLLYHYF